MGGLRKGRTHPSLLSYKKTTKPDINFPPEYTQNYMYNQLVRVELIFCGILYSLKLYVPTNIVGSCKAVSTCRFMCTFTGGLCDNMLL